jgi:hypothetical protein
MGFLHVVFRAFWVRSTIITIQVFVYVEDEVCGSATWVRDIEQSWARSAMESVWLFPNVQNIELRSLVAPEKLSASELSQVSKVLPIRDKCSSGSVVISWQENLRYIRLCVITADLRVLTYLCSCASFSDCIDDKLDSSSPHGNVYLVRFVHYAKYDIVSALVFCRKLCP